MQQVLDSARLPRVLGIDNAVTRPGYGAYQGRGSNPNMITQVGTPEEAKSLAETLGLLTKQDAVPYFYRNPQGDTRGARVAMDRAVTPSMLDYAHQATGLDFTRTDVDAMDFINFLDEGKPVSGLTDDEWAGKIANFFDNRAGVRDVDRYRATTNYNWTQPLWRNDNGKAELPSAGMGLLEARPELRYIGKELEKYNSNFIKQHGFADPRVLALMASLGLGGAAAVKATQQEPADGNQ